MYKNGKLNQLLKQDQALFHTQDLALLWGIKNKNTLYTTIKRYLQKGVLISVRKGLYSTKPIDKLNPIKPGVAYLHGFAYVSTETVLAQQGIILQTIEPITLVSSMSKKFQINSQQYICRQLKEEFLYNPTAIVQVEGYFQAEPYRALADLLYFNSRYHLDAQAEIDWKKLKLIQQKVGFK